MLFKTSEQQLKSRSPESRNLSVETVRKWPIQDFIELGNGENNELSLLHQMGN